MGNVNEQSALTAVDRPQLSEGPKIRGHVVQHSDRHHLLIIDGVIVACTPTEYDLLTSLLHHVEGHVPFALLAHCTYSSALDRSTRRTLTQHMSRLRAKLWPFGFDIFCITGYGYILLTKPPDKTKHEEEAKRRLG